MIISVYISVSQDNDNLLLILTIELLRRSGAYLVILCCFHLYRFINFTNSVTTICYPSNIPTNNSSI